VDDLLDFLRVTECRYLYLVGDFIDGWQLKSKWHWEDSYNVLIQKLLRKSRKETQIIYITGNHDEFIDQFLNVNFGSVMFAREVIHSAADGKRYLVLHGHQFDGIMHFNPPCSTASARGLRLDIRLQSPFQSRPAQSGIRVLVNRSVP